MIKSSQKRAYSYGCFLPAVLIICVIIFRLNIHWGTTRTIYIPEMNVYLKLDRSTFGKTARLGISRSDDVATDYIRFNYTQVSGPDIYYVKPDTFYVIDSNSFYIKDIKSNQFNMRYINQIHPQATLEPQSDTYDYFKIMENLEREDSIINAKKHYSMVISDNAGRLTVLNPSNKVIRSVELIYLPF